MQVKTQSPLRGLARWRGGSVTPRSAWLDRGSGTSTSGPGRAGPAAMSAFRLAGPGAQDRRAPREPRLAADLGLAEPEPVVLGLGEHRRHRARLLGLVQ